MKKNLFILLSLMILTSCFNNLKSEINNQSFESLKEEAVTYNAEVFSNEVSTVYNIFPIAYADSDGDGLGDLNGIINKIAYLKELGIDAVWLNPINSSNSYHKYDVKDYYQVDSDFGTNDDLKSLIKELHENDIKLILDMVFNHTSFDHPWFQKALDGDEKYQEYYRIVDDLSDYPSKDGWYQINDKYYYASFWDQMPEVNVNNPDVVNEFEDILKYYIDLGVDGFRYDAAKHIVDRNEVEIGEKVLEDNLNFWYKLKNYVKTIDPSIFLVAEVWDSQNAIAPYTTAFDSCFNFDFGSQVINIISNRGQNNFIENHNKYLDLMEKKNPNFIDSPFLTNHDQNRIASSLTNVNQLKLAATLLLSQNGLPFIYYGEEIGMVGSKPDELIREPMIFKDDFQSHYEAIMLNNEIDSVSQQLNDKDSLLNFYSEMIKIRKEYPSLKTEKLQQIQLHNSALLAYHNSDLTFILNLNSNQTSGDFTKELKPILQVGEYQLDENKITLDPYGIVVSKNQKGEYDESSSN